MLEYRTISQIAGPLLFVENVENAGYNEIVEITLPNGEKKSGQVLDTRKGLAIVQVFGPTTGLDVPNTSVKFLGDIVRLPVSDEMLGRVFDGKSKGWRRSIIIKGKNGNSWVCYKSIC